MLSLLLLFAASGFAADPSIGKCTSEVQSGKVCWASVLALHPTRFAVDEREVKVLEDKLADMPAEELQEYLETHPVQVVMGPRARMYLIDDHHLARVVWELGGKRIYAEVEANWKALSAPEFWERLELRRYLWLYNTDGVGPVSPRDELPRTVVEMKNDPYFALAAEVEKRGGYGKTGVPIARLQWATYFRSKMQPKTGEETSEDSVQKALKLAKKPDAKDLPGYLP
jgi:hypothetical protein